MPQNEGEESSLRKRQALEPAQSTPLFAGHSLAIAPEAGPLRTSSVPESPLLARLRAFIPALQAANAATAPTTTIEEVVDGDDVNDDDDDEEDSQSPSTQSPPMKLDSSKVDKAGAANNIAAVEMEVVLVPEDTEDGAAKKMVDVLAVDGDYGHEGSDRSTPSEPVVAELDIEKPGDENSELGKKVHPGIRVVSAAEQTTNRNPRGDENRSRKADSIANSSFSPVEDAAVQKRTRLDVVDDSP